MRKYLTADHSNQLTIIMNRHSSSYSFICYLYSFKPFKIQKNFNRICPGFQAVYSFFQLLRRKCSPFEGLQFNCSAKMQVCFKELPKTRKESTRTKTSEQRKKRTRDEGRRNQRSVRGNVTEDIFGTIRLNGSQEKRPVTQHIILHTPLSLCIKTRAECLRAK